MVVLKQRGKHVSRKVAPSAELTQLLQGNLPVGNPEIEVDHVHKLVNEVCLEEMF